jgi:hypothetical protein
VTGVATVDEPEVINVVLTFVEPDGRRWLAGALMSQLTSEAGPTEMISVSQLPERALSLVSFAVVKPTPLDRPEGQ